MEAVADAVIEFLPWYSSVHRGAGFASQVSTRAYEAARAAVADASPALARPDDGHLCPQHDGGDQPPHPLPGAAPGSRGPRARSSSTTPTCCPGGASPASTCSTRRSSPSSCSRTCAARSRTGTVRSASLAITGASNVTGEVFPLAEIAPARARARRAARRRRRPARAAPADRHGGDGHRLPRAAPATRCTRRSVAACWSAPSAVLGDAEPMLAGGGAVDLRRPRTTCSGRAPPDRARGRHRPTSWALSPWAPPCTVLGRTGMAAYRRAREAPASHTSTARSTIFPGCTGSGSGTARRRPPGVSTFTVDGMHHALVASILSAEYAIGVRHGCFCAHPYITHLLGVSIGEAHTIRERLRRGEHQEIPGAIRASFGIGTTVEHIDRLHRRAARDHDARSAPRIHRGSADRRLPAGRRPAAAPPVRFPAAPGGDGHPVRVRSVLSHLCVETELSH